MKKFAKNMPDVGVRSNTPEECAELLNVLFLPFSQITGKDGPSSSISQFRAPCLTESRVSPPQVHTYVSLEVGRPRQRKASAGSI